MKDFGTIPETAKGAITTGDQRPSHRGGYPVILGGDHAAFEAGWAASGCPDNERPDWPLPSFDAGDWADAFCKTVLKTGGFDPASPAGRDWVRGWFANALMRGYDEHAARGDRSEVKEPQE